MKRIKFLILLLPLLSGCYNYRELNELGITTAVSIDYKDNNFYVIAEVINPIKQQDASSSNNSPFINYNSSSSSLQDAFRKVVLESPRQLYAAQLEIIVLSEEVVNNHLEEVLEYFARDPESRTEIKIIVAKTEDSTKAITLQTLLTSLSSSNIIKSLDLQSKVLGMAYEIGDEKENITTSSPKAIVKIDGSTITKDNKILGYLDLEESKILNLINGKLKETIIKMNYYDGYIIFEPNRIKVSRELDIKNNIIKINISGYSKTKEIQSNINVKNPKEVEKLNKALNMELEKKITDTFNSIREKYDTDVFGFQELYYRTDYKYFKENCTNWYEDIYPKIKLEVKANVRLYEKGSTLGGLRYERKNK